MKIVFIAGPYYGGGDLRNIDKNIREAESYAIALANRGVGFFVPYLHTARFELRTTASEHYYKKLDMTFFRSSVMQCWQYRAGKSRAELAPR